MFYCESLRNKADFFGGAIEPLTFEIEWVLHLNRNMHVPLYIRDVYIIFRECKYEICLVNVFFDR